MGKRKYFINTNALTIENELSYYLLGAFITDGSVSLTPRYRANFASSDFDWINDIKNIICPELPIRKIGKNCSLIEISSKPFVEWLYNHNCIPAKSLTVKLPNIPDIYFKDFIRGCIDGDGSISLYKEGPNNYLRKICMLYTASKDFANQISLKLNYFNIKHVLREYDNANSIINGKEVKAKSKMYRIRFNGINAYNLCNFIYYDNCFAMKRKQDVAKSIIELYK